MCELQRREPERAALAAAVTGHALAGGRDVVLGAVGVDRSRRRDVGFGLLGVPDVSDADPVVVAWTDLLEEPSLHAHAVARELLPELRSLREDPSVHVAAVDP